MNKHNQATNGVRRGCWLQRIVRPLGIFIILWIFWSLFSFLVLKFCDPAQKGTKNAKPENSHLNQTNSLLHTPIKIINNLLGVRNGQMRNQILQIDGAGKLEQPCANENKQKHPSNALRCGVIRCGMIVSNKCGTRNKGQRQTADDCLYHMALKWPNVQSSGTPEVKP